MRDTSGTHPEPDASTMWPTTTPTSAGRLGGSQRFELVRGRDDA
jgi:hypothetical protein